ncbi:putative transmembrane protein [Cucumis melo var. makuwa]|uniref:Transmembrane protein n=1 Tax=Cucumis melo var. makuwa TaxID=1194695 RepID=A0A5A7TMZ1_CUCMM|nr:putative transmembrane protein [Cucumis melo var. makuwa]TYK16901.1 putative transmembrane protein [Cucumis melo var. makuwa]
MYRSASWNRFSDEYYSHSAPSSKPGQSLRLSSSFDQGNNELPMNDPVTEMVKREKARVKFAENAVHVIPFVLLICGIVLWFFSNPGK